MLIYCYMCIFISGFRQRKMVLFGLPSFQVKTSINMGKEEGKPTILPVDESHSKMATSEQFHLKSLLVHLSIFQTAFQAGEEQQEGKPR